MRYRRKYSGRISRRGKLQRVLPWLMAGLFIGIVPLSAQTHFIFNSNTGNNMTVLIETAINPSIDGVLMANGDEIGAFRPSGLCVGGVIWNGANCAISVWGDNELTNDTDGIRAGETLVFRVWSAARSKEIAASVTYAFGGPLYAVDGIASLSGLNAISEPSLPALSFPTNNTSGLSRDLTVIWHSSERASSYHVQIAIYGSFASIVKEDSVVPDTSEVLTGLVDGITYYWRVKAKNSNGSSVWSEVWNFTTAISVPFQASLLSPLHATTLLIDSVNFCWGKASPEVDKYSFEISNDSLMSSFIMNDSLITDTMTVRKGFTNKKSYWWRVKAHNSSGWGTLSDIRKFTIDIPPTAVSLMEYLAPKCEKSNSQLLIRYGLKTGSNVSLKLFNLQGRLIQTLFDSFQKKGAHQLSFTMTGRSKGCYILDFTAGGYSVTKKLSNLRSLE